MFKVTPVAEKSEQMRLCGLCGAKYRENYLAYGAYEGEKVLGICQFAIRGSAGYISEVCGALGSDDFEAVFILGRAVMNFIDLAGAHEAYYEGENSPFVGSLGFTPRDGKLYMNLSAFFESPCKNKK